MLEKLAVAYLRYKKVSIIIGFRLKNTSLYELYNKCYFYDNEFEIVLVYDTNLELFNIPRGKFNVRYSKED